VLYLGIASQAGRFFVEAQRSGLIELLLATPLTVRQIVQGQWRALLRMFGAPLTLCLGAQLVGAVLVQQMTWDRFAAAPPAFTPTTTATNNAKIITTTTATGTATAISVGGYAAPHRVLTLAISVVATLTVLANLVALSWFGMWMGLTSKTANLATLKTIAFVQVIPWFVVTFASGMVVPLLLLPGLMKGTGAASSQIVVWYPVLTSGLASALSLIKDSAFWLWARRKLYSEFRACAVRIVAPIWQVLPPPLPPPDAPPAVAPT
jgi:hypothetical protein